MTIQLMKQNSTSKCFLLEKGKCSNFKVIFLDMYILQIRPFCHLTAAPPPPPPDNNLPYKTEHRALLC